MRLVFTQELSKFTRDMFADALELNSSMVDDCLFRLLKRHVIATGAIDESEDSDSVNVDDYCFKWVGLAVYGDITLAVCPKYFPRFDHIFVDGNDLPDEKRQWLLKRMARILRVIRKADAKSVCHRWLSGIPREPAQIRSHLFCFYSTITQNTGNTPITRDFLSPTDLEQCHGNERLNNARLFLPMPVQCTLNFAQQPAHAIPAITSRVCTNIC